MKLVNFDPSETNVLLIVAYLLCILTMLKKIKERNHGIQGWGNVPYYTNFKTTNFGSLQIFFSGQVRLLAPQG